MQLLSLPGLWKHTFCRSAACASYMVGKTFYGAKFGHFPVANFTSEKRLFVFSLQGADCRLCFSIFSLFLPRGWVSFVVQAETSSGARHPALTAGLLLQGLRPSGKERLTAGLRCSPGLSRLCGLFVQPWAGFKLFTIANVNRFTVNGYLVFTTQTQHLNIYCERSAFVKEHRSLTAIILFQL